MKTTTHINKAVGLCLALISSGSALGDVILTSGTNGQLSVPAVDSGADSYVLDGGIFAGPFNATFNSGLVLTGDVGEAYVVNVTDPLHYIHNWGSLTGGAGMDGVLLSANMITNAGLMNHSLISGDVGISGSANRVNLTNYGQITGNTATGVDLGDSSFIANGDGSGFDPGTILGATRGVRVGDNARVVNNRGSSITGTAGDGIAAGTGSNITNYTSALISGGDDGIDAGDDATIFNSGRIVGSDYGTSLGGSSSVTNASGGSITGTNLDGVLATDEAIIDNQSGASIWGSIDGVDVDSGRVTNRGTITGDSGDGIEGDFDTAGNTVVNNYSIIRGGDIGINLNDGNDTVNNWSGGNITGGTVGVYSGNGMDTVSNYGTITGDGGLAIDLAAGDDTLWLRSGSRVNGNVDGGDDTDVINFQWYNTTTGDVFGFEDANKVSGGLSLVTGSLTSERLDVQSGMLTLLNGMMGATDVEVGGFGSFAELGGLGTFISDDINVNSRGVVSPGSRPISEQWWNAIGSAELRANTDFNNGSTYRVDYNPSNNSHDFLTVRGDLNLNAGSTLAVSPTSVDAPIQDGSRRVINQIDAVAGDNTTGNFTFRMFDLEGDVVNAQANSAYWVSNTGNFNSSAVTLGSFVRGDYVYMTVNHDYTNIPGLSASGNAFAQYLNTILAEAPGNSTLSDFLGFIDYSNDNLVADVLNSYDPSLHISVGDTLVHTGHTLNRVVENHLNMVRNQDAPAPAPAPQYDAKGGVIAAAPSGSTYGHKWTAWVTGSFENLNYERGGTSSLRDIDGNSASATVGIDYKVSDSFYLGILGQLGRTDLDEGSFTEVETDSTYFGLYGTFTGLEGFFFDFLVAYGDHDIDTQRYVFPGSANASYGADGFTGMIGGGYMMGGGGSWKWGPVASLEYQNMDIDSFSETGALGLSVKSRSIDSFRSLLGVKAEYTGGRFDLYGAIRWAHDFSGSDDRDITGGFGGLGGGFSTSAYSRSEDSLVLNLGVSTAFTDWFSLGLGYFGEVSLDDNGVDAHGGSLEASFSF